jgi:hypothetical protein
MFRRTNVTNSEPGVTMPGVHTRFADTVSLSALEGEAGCHEVREAIDIGL